jgi:diguanylate cyclase (GGDEF)-like protein
MDINGLNQINRRLGTHFGDRVIRAVGNLLVSQCRVRDVISHTGGGQFAILVAGETRAGADRLAERLCGQVREQLRYHDGKELDLHCSYGVADCAILGGLPLVERAAQALNRAKQNGGDRVSITRPPRQTPHWAS